jgi:2-succinyl-6-hydroxy-2,4-cyclohexadiene-1-carboxylate synthase
MHKILIFICLSLKIFALHGFLGSPQDFDGLLPFESTHFVKLTVAPFLDWAKAFNAYAARVCQGKRVLLGYSMGGRLAMHALVDQPEIWDAAIIVSANPGISEKERQDENWAKRFESDPWDGLIEDWEAQNVFGGHKMGRREADFSRADLANMMRQWSLSNQENLTEKIAGVKIPILWVTGRRDEKFAKLAKNVLLSHDKSRKWQAPNCAHRVPWEGKDIFQKEIQRFIEEL